MPTYGWILIAVYLVPYVLTYFITALANTWFNTQMEKYLDYDNEQFGMCLILWPLAVAVGVLALAVWLLVAPPSHLWNYLKSKDLTAPKPPPTKAKETPTCRCVGGCTPCPHSKT